MMHDAEGVHEVELAIRVWEELGVSGLELGLPAVQPKVSRRDLKVRRCQIDAVHFRALTREIKVIGSHAISDLQRLLASDPERSNGLEDPWMTHVPVRLDLGKVFGR
jgi:hypothetical protein